ncbi:DUF6799 domain-containing protein [Rufibacter latericius]|uniref:DUF6799 domain-containing protein n=1 Tax=Rufibacter latericius TaxID=2487040 RepID=A0A3M9MK45_9BACT|nr:DUF6799 domain-containing protein [Rufibacter latericius]RNI25866.1 hypothetical protein EFB08_13555 [Rufibacter latericius]
MRHRFILTGGLLIGLFCAPVLVQAQSASIGKKESGRTTTTSVTPLREGIIMRNGKMMEIRGTNFSPLTQARTFSNGATLQPNGSLTVSGGEAIQLNEGDHVDLKGNVHRTTVITHKSTTVTGDTTGIGKQLLQAQQMNDQLRLLQEKQRVLQQKNELLQKTVQNKPTNTELQKLDADLAKLQQQLAAEEKKKQ